MFVHANQLCFRNRLLHRRCRPFEAVRRLGKCICCIKREKCLPEYQCNACSACFVYKAFINTCIATDAIWHKRYKSFLNRQRHTECDKGRQRKSTNIVYTLCMLDALHLCVLCIMLLSSKLFFRPFVRSFVQAFFAPHSLPILWLWCGIFVLFFLDNTMALISIVHMSGIFILFFWVGGFHNENRCTETCFDKSLQLKG